MPKVNADEFTEKWQRRLPAALDDVRRGVEKVQVSPTEAAAKAKEKWQAKLQEAIAKGKWEQGLKRVTIDEWKNKMINVGISRIPSGVEAAGDKVKAFAEQLLAHEAELQRKISAMRDVTLEDAINRATAWIRGMAEFKRR